MSKFKAGDLALIVDCLLPELIGKTVELVQLVSAYEVAECSGRLWNNRSEHRGWVVTADGLLVLTVSGRIETDRFTLMDERKLMPLRGDFQPEQQKAKGVEA